MGSRLRSGRSHTHSGSWLEGHWAPSQPGLGKRVPVSGSPGWAGEGAGGTKAESHGKQSTLELSPEGNSSVGQEDTDCTLDAGILRRLVGKTGWGTVNLSLPFPRGSMKLNQYI